MYRYDHAGDRWESKSIGTVPFLVFDKNLIALASDKMEGPKQNQRRGTEIWHEEKKVDVVEFFISFGDTHFFFV